MTDELLKEPGGALLIDKPAGISSFGVIEELQRHAMRRHPGVKRRELPKMGHGGTLDPFATGLLTVCVGRAVKLARYFLGAPKTYEGVIRFGETTIPGDPTAPISETSPVRPESLEQLRELARSMTLQQYLQTPPMHSAKKKDGKPLYELARAGLEVDRQPKLCSLYSFEILSYADSRAEFRLVCSSGTYVRTLAQDMARMLGTVALVEVLRRTASGNLRIANSLTLDQLAQEESRDWSELPSWVPFDRLLDGYDRAQATDEEAQSLFEGRQKVLFNILRRVQPAPGVTLSSGAMAGRSKEQDTHIAIFRSDELIAVAREDAGQWGLERVFTRE